MIPRPHQFYYTKVTEVGGGVIESWLSISGVRDGLILSRSGKIVVYGCRSGHETFPVPGGTVSQPCVPDPAYLPNMPTTASQMSAFLTRLSALGGRPVNLATRSSCRSWPKACS